MRNLILTLMFVSLLLAADIKYLIILGPIRATSGQVEANEFNSQQQYISSSSNKQSDESFTFTKNGSSIQIDAGREWPFSSKREISLRFRTKSPHGLLLYQTLDHSKLAGVRDANGLPVDEALGLGLTPSQAAASIPPVSEIEPQLRSSLTSSGQFTRDGSKSTVSGASAAAILSAAKESAQGTRLGAGGRSVSSLKVANADGSLISASSASSILLLSSASAAASGSGAPLAHELYLKLENGRLRVMYELGSRLNQTYCGRGLNDDRWHRVELKVDPEMNQVVLVLDMMVTVEITLISQQQQVSGEEESGSGSGGRRNSADLAFNSHSILYLGGLDPSQLSSRKPQRRQVTQFIGCIGQIMLRTDQQAADISPLQPAPIDKMVAIKRGCLNRCDTDNYCLHQSTCLNYYSHTKCDCYGTNYEDSYCWQDQLTSLSMLGYSTLVYRIYDWRDRHHSSINRLSLQFRTLALDSILFFAYGDLSSQSQQQKQQQQQQLQPSLSAISPSMLLSPTLTAAGGSNPLNVSNLTIHPRPATTTMGGVGGYQSTLPFQLGNSNHLAVSLSNGSIVVELNFGDQPILLSNLLYDKLSSSQPPGNKSSASSHNRLLSLSDGRWHNVTLIHNNKQLSLHVDDHSVGYQLVGKNSHLYFDPSIYFGAVPNLLLNETRALVRPFNLRHKFVGCLKSVYFNHHDILLALKQNLPSVEYRDPVGGARLNSCLVQEPSSLPLTLKSGKSYLTFQLTPTNSQPSPALKPTQPEETSDITGSSTESTSKANSTERPLKKLTRIEFEYKTSLQAHFLAGGHLRDLSYHDLGGFWTLHAQDHCQLIFTISSGLTFEPEQVIRLATSSSDSSTEQQSSNCDSKSWYRISLSMISGDKVLNLTRTRVNTVSSLEDEYKTSSNLLDPLTSGDNLLMSADNLLIEEDSNLQQHKYDLKTSIELLHQVQIGGDLAKFGESSSVPFSGCIRRIKINGHLFDSRDFVTSSSSHSGAGTVASSSIAPLASVASNLMAQGLLNSSSSSRAAWPSLLGPTQSDGISSRMAQGYVTLDSCQVVNPCVSLNPCKNQGVCRVNELGEPDCDCSKTGYTGRRCHFSIYKQSCQELYLSGQRKSSMYLIDLDRNGPLKPIRVRCNMEGSLVQGDTNSNPNGQHQIETVLVHNLPADYLIRDSASRDLMVDITYMAFHHLYTSEGFYIYDDTDPSARASQELMLRSLIDQSLYCRQYIRFECRSSPLELGNRTWMEAPYPRVHRIESLESGGFSSTGSGSGGHPSRGRCPCAGSEKKCLDPTKGCNCDSGEPTDDSAHLVGREQVGLTRVVILKQQPQQQQLAGGDSSLSRDQFGPEAAQTRFTLSDLKCYGAKKHESQHEITFKTSDAYIEVPGWRRGDISFSFRTASLPPAIILYQLATSRNHGYFRLTLISDTRLMFEFIVNRRPKKLYLSSTHKLNNGEWQQVFIEYDSANLRLTINDDAVMIDLEPNDYLGTFEGPLFVGGAPSKYLAGDPTKRNGFTGCFRALIIDGNSIDLRSYLSPSMPTVTSACRPSCTKNLCQNGGTCIEYWGSYECECSNPIAHSGSNCEINLNTNSITFVTQESYYVQLSNDSYLQYPSYLIKNILLNIRTYQETALILYASDHLNNFIQLHKNGSSLVLTFNSNSTIVVAQVPIEDEPSATSPAIVMPPATQSPLVPVRPVESSPLANLALTSGSSVASNSTTTAKTMIATNTSGSSPKALPGSLQNKSTTTGNSSSFPAGQIPNLSASGAMDKSMPIKISNTSGSGQPIQVKIERHRLRTTFYVNNNFVIVEEPILYLTNYTQNPWQNPELELVRPPRPKMGSKTYLQIFLANVDEYFSTRLPGFTGCVQGLSIDNQLFDFNRAHLTGELKGEYRIGCKMHCDSFPCKNQGTCIENWKEDRIQCKCDTTSYVGSLCDEDVAAIFNGHSSYFLYHLSKKYSSLSHRALANRKQQSTIINRNMTRISSSSSDTIGSAAQHSTQHLAALLNATTNYTASSTNVNLTKDDPIIEGTAQLIDIGEMINYFEVNLAFSTDSVSNQSTQGKPEANAGSVQVLVLITRASSAKHFFLGLTPDGSLIIQEDYGNSMSLSRLIKRPDNSPYNDGHRHMVKYTRLNQTIQIIVDYQTYLPTMSVITTNNLSKFFKSSVILVGTVADKLSGSWMLDSDSNATTSYSNYIGCISNLVVKMDDMVIEPLSEAFGQDIETINLNTTNLVKGSTEDKASTSNLYGSFAKNGNGELPALQKGSRGMSAAIQLQRIPGVDDPMDDFETLRPISDDGSLPGDNQPHHSLIQSKTLSLVSKNGKEVIDEMETIVARDVEQGKCSPFKRIEVVSEKRSVNEPKYTPLLEPRPVYMDPPRIKLYKRSDKKMAKDNSMLLNEFNALFYISLSILTLIATSTLIYAYILQRRYKSEKFRCETPFFHKRDDLAAANANLATATNKLNQQATTSHTAPN